MQRYCRAHLGGSDFHDDVKANVHEHVFRGQDDQSKPRGARTSMGNPLLGAGRTPTTSRIPTHGSGDIGLHEFLPRGGFLHYIPTNGAPLHGGPCDVKTYLSDGDEQAAVDALRHGRRG
ncbi:hypothetical protein GQ600_6432 [Phytophthora cactorum]|nr:hypothetical protein GQ600_6432 [Phytophthora cactorum]